MAGSDWKIKWSTHATNAQSDFRVDQNFVLSSIDLKNPVFLPVFFMVLSSFWTSDVFCFFAARLIPWFPTWPWSEDLSGLWPWDAPELVVGGMFWNKSVFSLIDVSLTIDPSFFFLCRFEVCFRILAPGLFLGDLSDFLFFFVRPDASFSRFFSSSFRFFSPSSQKSFVFFTSFLGEAISIGSSTNWATALPFFSSSSTVFFFRSWTFWAFKTLAKFGFLGQDL